jgi:hypothetical protein
MITHKQSSFKLAPKQLTPKRPLHHDYSASAHRAPTPSDDFDWDAALRRYALLMRDLGYSLSSEQQERINAQ